MHFIWKPEAQDQSYVNAKEIDLCHLSTLEAFFLIQMGIGEFCSLKKFYPLDPPGKHRH